MEIFDGWVTWQNAFYVLFLALTGVLTIASAKWRTAVKELIDVVKTIEKALEDGKIDEDEKQEIMKEAIQAGWAVVRATWGFKK
jgi:hypothetical protein